MVALIKDNMNEIHDVCKKHHVKSFYLIGSAAREEKDFRQESDVDFLYRFNYNDIEGMDYADNYFSLLFTLQDLLKRKVDLVAEERIRNPYFLESINKYKRLVYES